MKHLTNTIKENYYRYNPGEFLPIYSDGKLLNRAEFHAYRIKWIISNRAAAWHMFTHQAG